MADTDKLKYTYSDQQAHSFSNTLDELDSLLGRLDSKNKQVALKILSLMDEVHHKYLDQLKYDSSGNPENSQLSYLYRRIYQHAEVFVRALGGAALFADERNSRQVSDSDWWWFLDRYVENKRRKSLIKTIKWLGVAALVLMVLIFVYQKFLAPPPEVRERLRYENQASIAIAEGRIEDALAGVEAAIQADPDEFELWVQRGVLLIALDQQDEAEQSFQKALSLENDPEFFTIEKAYYAIQLGLLDMAQEEVDQLLSIDSESVEAFLFQGQILESQGDIVKAIEIYQKASEMAEAQNKIELMTTIRVRLATLMQSALIPTMEN